MELSGDEGISSEDDNGENESEDELVVEELEEVKTKHVPTQNQNGVHEPLARY